MVAKAFTSSVSTIVKCHSSSGISPTAASFSPTRCTYSCSSMSLCTPICCVKATCICLAVRTSLLSFFGFSSSLAAYTGLPAAKPRARQAARQASLPVNGRIVISASGPRGTGPGLDAGEAGKLTAAGRPDGLLQAVLLAEAVDAAAGVHDLLLARVERVAVRADFDLEVGPERRARLEGVATAAGHRDVGVGRVNAFFHSGIPLPCCVGAAKSKGEDRHIQGKPGAESAQYLSCRIY